MKAQIQVKTTKDAILDATDKLLAAYGYKKMTIDDLAREVGIGKGSVYLHFESKEEIALSHIDRIIDRIKVRLNEIADSKMGPEQKVRKMIVERVLIRFDSVQHYTQSLNEILAQVRPRLLERRHRYFEDEARIIGRGLAEGKNSGVFSIKDPLDIARTIIDATNALLPYSLSAYELGERSEIEEKAKKLTDVILKGVLKR